MIVQERRTVAESVSWSGKGLHGGQAVRVTVHPGDRGIWFRAGGASLEAIPENVADTSRCTSLPVARTIEHLMSALAGLEVTDAEIEVQGGELPGLDGSSKEYVEGLLDVGLASVGTVEREPLFERVFVQEESIKVAVSSGRGVWRYGFLSDAWPFEQEFESIDIVGEFREEIAPARTWAFEHELPAIEQLGLGRGLDATSAVVLGKQGYVNEVRFPDEPARHKLLDLIGDLYLAGFPIRQLNVSACRSGHRAHVEAARRLRHALSRTES